MAESISNRELQLAEKFVQQTGANIFLTGKAGTGKTTFLSRLKRITSKRMVITAPTGGGGNQRRRGNAALIFSTPFRAVHPRHGHNDGQ